MREKRGAPEKPPTPTRAELAILKVLWGRGPATVREVHQNLSRTRPIGYTTVLKTLQIMTVKGLVRRDPRERAHVYTANGSEHQTQRRLLADLIDRAFGGSAARLVLHVLDARKLTEAERREIRTLLGEFEKSTEARESSAGRPDKGPKGPQVKE
jgi:BlaI family transcriptional regulator, penicillinase repressor